MQIFELENGNGVEAILKPIHVVCILIRFYQMRWEFFSLDYKGLSMAFKKLKKPFENFIFDGYCLYYNCYCLQNYITIFMSNLLLLNAAEAENVRFQLEEH